MKNRIPLALSLALILMTPSVSRAAVLPEVRTYDELRSAISQARSESRLRTEQAVEAERVLEAWQIGRLIDTHVLQHQERADYASHVLDRLAEDLGMSRTELSYMLQFARAYPIFPAPEKLSWAHYRELLSVNDSTEREALAEQAVNSKWNQKELREKVRTRKAAKSGTQAPEPETLLPSEPGKPGTYRVVRAPGSQSTELTPLSLRAKRGNLSASALEYQRKHGPLALDLGFSNYVSLSSLHPKADTLKEGDIVVSSLKAVGHSKDLFTYEAYVLRVLDGDTLEAVVDLGFGFTTMQVLRLRGIDAPEVNSHDGLVAKEALEKMLSRSTRVLIRSVKSDKYDRYLVDVYGIDPQGKVVYINNQLVEDGNASKVRG